MGAIASSKTKYGVNTLLDTSSFDGVLSGTDTTVQKAFDTIDDIAPASIGAEPAFSKNTAFNKDFGATTGTVTEGDDARLSDARTPLAHNLAGAGHTADTLANLNLKISDDNAQGTSEKSQPNGYASLDSGGKVPASQLDVVGLNYLGAWNANTNTPAIADGGSGDNAGDYYTVDTAGTQDLGSGSISFDVGDWVIYSGTTWQKIDNTDQVTSVFGRQGAVVAASGDYTHSQIGSIGTDDHHAKSHVHDGVDGSGQVAHSSTTGQTANDHHAQAHNSSHITGGADIIPNYTDTASGLAPLAGTDPAILTDDGWQTNRQTTKVYSVATRAELQTALESLRDDPIVDKGIINITANITLNAGDGVTLNKDVHIRGYASDNTRYVLTLANSVEIAFDRSGHFAQMSNLKIVPSGSNAVFYANSDGSTSFRRVALKAQFNNVEIDVDSGATPAEHLVSYSYYSTVEVELNLCTWTNTTGKSFDVVGVYGSGFDTALYDPRGITVICNDTKIDGLFCIRTADNASFSVFLNRCKVTDTGSVGVWECDLAGGASATQVNGKLEVIYDSATEMNFNLISGGTSTPIFKKLGGGYRYLDSPGFVTIQNDVAYHNTSATGVEIYTLPDPNSSFVPPGFKCKFLVEQNLKIRVGQPLLGQIIVNGFSTTIGTSGYIESDVVGSVIELEYLGSNKWFASYSLGTWLFI